jgi:serine/threonine protein kinase
VQDWLLLGCHGHGGSGVLYRAVRIGHESEGPVALKMALFPWDPRYMREVALLALVQHSNVPRLLGHGFWRRPDGLFFSFIVMEWIEGTPLYEWALQQQPSHARRAQALAHLASALQAAHQCLALHRDVKGDNVLVRHSDGRAMLTDFGAGTYPSAPRITSQPLPPGTPPYRSPEAVLFALNAGDDPHARYQPGPADDVFALGVTAYRLVTGEYPLSLKPPLDGVEPPLRALLLRMLSPSPEDRGTAGELAKAFAAVAAQAKHPPRKARPSRFRPWVQRSTPRAWGTWSLAAVLLVLGAWHLMHLHSQSASVPQQPADSGRTEAGTSRLAEALPEAPKASSQPPAKQEAISQEAPPELLPGQLHPDARGRCPGRHQVPLHGGCWVEHPAKDAAECEEKGQVFIQGRCYARAFGHRRRPPPTSAPADSR